jgi:hypothetical protein
VARSVEAARADADAAAAERDVTLVAVAAEVARAYADACSGARQTAVAEESLKIQTQSFSLTEKQYSAGRGSRVEISRARAQLELQVQQVLQGRKAAQVFKVLPDRKERQEVLQALQELLARLVHLRDHLLFNLLTLMQIPQTDMLLTLA